MRFCLFGLAQCLMQLRQFQVNFAHHAGLGCVGQCLLEMALRLAPKLLLQALGSQRKRQFRVGRALADPIFATFNLRQQRV